MQPTQLTSPLNTASDLLPTQPAGPISDLGALTRRREQIATKDAQHLALSERLRELKDNEENVQRSFEQTKSSLKSVKEKIDDLKHKQEDLIERRQSSKQWLFKQRKSQTGEDLDQLEEMIKEAEEAITELDNQIDELEMKIKAWNKQVAEMSAQLEQKEDEKKQLEIKMDEIEKEKSTLESRLKDDRIAFENEVLEMIDKQKQSEVST